MNTNGAWNVVAPTGTGGKRQSWICDSAHEASRCEPVVFCTTLASVTSPEAATVIATTSSP